MLHLAEMREDIFRGEYKDFCYDTEDIYDLEYDLPIEEYLSGGISHHFTDYDDDYNYIQESFAIYNYALHCFDINSECIKEESILGEAYYNSLNKDNCTTWVKYIKEVLRLLGQYIVALPMLVEQLSPFISDCINILVFENRFEHRKKEMR